MLLYITVFWENIHWLIYDRDLEHADRRLHTDIEDIICGSQWPEVGAKNLSINSDKQPELRNIWTSFSW